MFYKHKFTYIFNRSLFIFYNRSLYVLYNRSLHLFYKHKFTYILQPQVYIYFTYFLIAQFKCVCPINDVKTFFDPNLFLQFQDSFMVDQDCNFFFKSFLIFTLKTKCSKKFTCAEYVVLLFNCTKKNCSQIKQHLNVLIIWKELHKAFRKQS